MLLLVLTMASPLATSTLVPRGGPITSDSMPFQIEAKIRGPSLHLGEDVFIDVSLTNLRSEPQPIPIELTVTVFKPGEPNFAPLGAYVEVLPEEVSFLDPFTSTELFVNIHIATTGEGTRVTESGIYLAVVSVEGAPRGFAVFTIIDEGSAGTLPTVPSLRDLIALIPALPLEEQPQEGAVLNPAFSGHYNTSENRAWPRDYVPQWRYNNATEPPLDLTLNSNCGDFYGKTIAGDHTDWRGSYSEGERGPNATNRPNIQDGVNVAGWRMSAEEVYPAPSSAVGSAHSFFVYDLASRENRIYEVDISFFHSNSNGAINWGFAPPSDVCRSGPTRFHGVSAHEVGHYWGMMHMMNPGDPGHKPWMGGDNMQHVMYFRAGSHYTPSASERIGYQVVYGAHSQDWDMGNHEWADDVFDLAYGSVVGTGGLDDRLVGSLAGGDLDFGLVCTPVSAYPTCRGPNPLYSIGPTSGIGVGIGTLDSNAFSDALAVWATAESGDNHLRYGVVANFNDPTFLNGPNWVTREMPGGIGWTTQGVAACFADMNGGALDVVLAWIDNPVGGNSIKYRVGYGIGVNGGVPNWSEIKTVEGGTIGDNTPGLGMACGEFDYSNLDTDIVFAWLDDPGSETSIRYRVGYNFAPEAESWSETKRGPRGYTLNGGARSLAVGWGNTDASGENDLDFRYTQPDVEPWYNVDQRFVMRESRVESGA